MSTEHVHTSDSRTLVDRMRAYGCPIPIFLDEPLMSPDQIEYLDLLPSRTSDATLSAVAEHQGTALLYLLDSCGEVAADDAAIQRLQRQLANRSDPAWLGVARLGSLELYPIGFHEEGLLAPLVTIPEDSQEAPLLYQNLVHGGLEVNRHLHGSDYVFKKIYRLLSQTIDRYVQPEDDRQAIEPLEVLSMAGRALFFRFLIDRRIVREEELGDICPQAGCLKDSFANAENAALVSAWLDDTFNGDFLQLIDESIPETDRAARHRAYSQYYSEVEQRVGHEFFDHLHAILNGWSKVGDGFQTELDWGDFDFAHIPVGVLSQVYESFSHRLDHRAAKRTSTHYTPRNIAGLMVDQVFSAVKDPAAVTVLDPACGAGIFLVLAFRRLVRERWCADKERPRTRTIQRILYGQLRGFDISESALRLASLALYITAIEINGTQRPPKSLKFPKNLRDSVLFDFSEPLDATSRASRVPFFALGSLGPKVPSKLDGTFDIVIGNPPWTRLREEELQSTEEQLAESKTVRPASAKMNQEFTSIGRRVLRKRGLTELADTYENPDKNPDLPFLWRAGEWAKEGDGVIALALPARVFGRTSGKGYKAWSAILRSFSITGLINGADLRKTAVWESIDMPFALFFALNAVAPEGHRFYYATPKYEPSQNRHARFRIDYEATRPISVKRVQEQPWVLKTLSLGTWRDVAVMEKILAAFPQTLETAWKEWNPKGDRTGQGYNRSASLKQKPAAFLGSLLDFESAGSGFSIEYSALRTYIEKYGQEDDSGVKRASAHRPKTSALYKPPLVIIPKAPGGNPQMPRSFMSRRSLAFSQSYYGYSCDGHPEAALLAALLYLVAHSSLFRYFALMTSVSQGADHMIFTKRDLDSLPFPDVSSLDASVKTMISKLARRLEQDRRKPWEEINSLLFDLYGLDEGEAQVVRDTIFSAAAYRHRGRPALERTRRNDRDRFSLELRKMLQPYFGVCGEEARIGELLGQPDTWEQPWFFVSISRASEEPRIGPDLLLQAMEEANRLSASRVLVRMPEQRGLLIGLLNQRRWWTVTRARLCGQLILRHHLDTLGLA